MGYLYVSIQILALQGLNILIYKRKFIKNTSRFLDHHEVDGCDKDDNGDDDERTKMAPKTTHLV